MSILGFNNSNNNMSSSSINPVLYEFKKQASFFLKEKLKSARLALTDVTPVQLLTEEATNANAWAPDAPTLRLISRSAFEIDDYWRIVHILHSRLSKFDRKNWRPSYKALIVLEHLLTHGPESVAEEFQDDKPVIRDMLHFQHVDEKGFNWGLAVRKKSERVLKLLEKGPLLKQERDSARKLTREIKGFGSFSVRTGIPTAESTRIGRSHSQFHEHGNQDKTTGVDDNGPETSLSHGFSATGEVKPLLGSHGPGTSKMLEEEDHPFSYVDNASNVSLLVATGEE